MFCTFCGADIGDSNIFCKYCGGTIQKDKSNISQWVYRSKARLASTNYYCFNCGCLVDRNRASYYGDINCHTCGLPIIKADWGNNVLNNINRRGLFNGLINSFAEASERMVINSSQFIFDYYNSAYFHQTGYLFEDVATDKGKMGEYLIEVNFRRAANAFPMLNPCIYFNVLVPESNGSFQEIDALVIIGGAIFVIEAKNRSGEFRMNRISDKYWNLHQGESVQQIYSPLRQNSEHIVALQEFIHNAIGLSPHFYNYVALSGKGHIGYNVKVDAIDNLILGWWRVGSYQDINNYFRQMFYEIINSDYNDNIYSEEHKIKIIKALEPLINMPENKKELLKEERLNDNTKNGKIDYRYYYFEEKLENPVLIRTNFVHVQGLVNDRWLCGINNFEFIKDGDSIDEWYICIKNQIYPTYSYTVKTDEELLEIVKCVSNRKRYNKVHRRMLEKYYSERFFTFRTVSEGWWSEYKHPYPIKDDEGQIIGWYDTEQEKALREWDEIVCRTAKENGYTSVVEFLEAHMVNEGDEHCQE